MLLLYDFRKCHVEPDLSKKCTTFHSVLQDYRFKVTPCDCGFAFGDAQLEHPAEVTSDDISALMTFGLLHQSRPGWLQQFLSNLFELRKIF